MVNAKSNGRLARVLNTTDTDANLYSSIDYSYSEPTVDMSDDMCHYYSSADEKGKPHKTQGLRKGPEVKAKPPPLPPSVVRGKPSSSGNTKHTPSSEWEGLGEDRVYADPDSESASPGRNENGNAYTDPKAKRYNTVCNKIQIRFNYQCHKHIHCLTT